MLSRGYDNLIGALRAGEKFNASGIVYDTRQFREDVVKYVEDSERLRGESQMPRLGFHR